MYPKHAPQPFKGMRLARVHHHQTPRLEAHQPGTDAQDHLARTKVSADPKEQNKEPKDSNYCTSD